ncbi:FAD-binding-3 domain-containing protein [Favolaschia claudopus]|uniref:FAD-binding-3 domain-containing protein n=1 Tax=Favolaschia claudopus TaxID=2862362 RepID=A0AAW0EJC9_9AGAR
MSQALSLPERTTVLIVGAGPVGMAAALSLHHQGIRDFVVVDAILAGENTSRAMVIQAATLEALNNIGCLDGILSIGVKVQEVGLHYGSSYLLTADFSLLEGRTKFPFGLTIPQAKTEAKMLEKLTELGIKVWRPIKVVSVKPSQQAADQDCFDVRFDSGEVLKAKYVVGADGVRSVVREQAGISYKDPHGDDNHDYGNLSQLVLGDVAFTSEPRIFTQGNKLSLTLSAGNMVLLAPFPPAASPDAKRTVYRLATSVPVEFGTAPSEPTIEYLQRLIDRHGPMELSSNPAINPHPTRIDKMYFSSRYKTRSAVAESFFAPRKAGQGGGFTLLVGDAAHCHSPIGGQGMSLGIRDAISLGPVLKAHIDSSAKNSGANPDKMFEEWSATRRDRAFNVVALTKRALGIFTAQGKMWPPFLFLMFSVLRFLGGFKFVKRNVAYRLSGLAEI